MKVQELGRLVSSLRPSEFRRQLGPFVLIQRPPRGAEKHAEADEVTNPWGAEAESTTLARPGAVSQGTISLLFQFDGLDVATLPPLQGVDELSVGRQVDCDLVVNDASVSKRHALLRWDAENKRATVVDLNSTNGTFLNAETQVKGEATVNDGDIISFGEVQFWYLLTETLHAKLVHERTSKLPRGV